LPVRERKTSSRVPFRISMSSMEVEHGHQLHHRADVGRCDGHAPVFVDGVQCVFRAVAQQSGRVDYPDPGRGGGVQLLEVVGLENTM
jgi:hypothetical protein